MKGTEEIDPGQDLITKDLELRSRNQNAKQKPLTTKFTKITKENNEIRSKDGWSRETVSFCR